MSTDAGNTSGDAGETDGGSRGRFFGFDEDLTSALQGGALAVALLFALISAVGFYASAQRVIQVWVAGPYRPLFTMGFNLAVLLAMVALVVALARRLSS